jgi:SAM-dependent methyltransferase
VEAENSMTDWGGADLYDALAPIYDDWQASDGMTPFALVTRAKLAPLLAREVRVSGAGSAARTGRPFSFLELGCGTGTLLLALGAAESGWRLAGADASAAMLAVAARKPRARTLTLARAALDRALPFAAGFDAAGVFYDTLNHLPDPSALARAFVALSSVVRPGGLLVFDVTNRQGFERWWRGRNEFRGPRWHISVEARFDPEADLGRADVTVARNGEARSFELVERYLADEDILNALSAAGFDVERREGWAPFANDAEGKTWWVARRANKSR